MSTSEPAAPWDPPTDADRAHAGELWSARNEAVHLVEEIATRNLIRPGVGERAAGEQLEQPDLTGDELFAYACGLAAEAGWDFGGKIA